MHYRIIGALLIIGSCSGFGFSLALHHLREIRLLSALNTMLDTMLCELKYKLTPLPELIRNNAEQVPAVLKQVLMEFAENLDRQILPDVPSCMHAALYESTMSYRKVCSVLNALGQSLGRFDLNGQISGLNNVKDQCTQELQNLKEDHRNQVKSYRILGICAGIALAVFLL